MSHEKPSAVKKLLKPQRNVLQLVVERNSRNSSSTNHHTGQSMLVQDEWSEESYGSKRSSVALSSNSTPTYKRRNQLVPESLTQISHSPEMESKATGYSVAKTQERDRERDRECEHGTQPVKERESYSSSRYAHQKGITVWSLKHILCAQGFIFSRYGWY